MIKVSEIAKKYADYEIDEKELEKLLVKPKPKNVLDLKYGDKCWILWADGCTEIYKWDNYALDVDRRNCGNIFLTKEEAEFELERRKCEAIMLKYGARDMMSLGDCNTEKWCIVCNYEHKKMFIDYFKFNNFQGVIWFASKEIAQQCIDEIGEDRLKKYIFNVKE